MPACFRESSRSVRRQLFTVLSLILCLPVLLPGCATEEEILADAVTQDSSFVSSVVPIKGPPGARVRIRGSEFGESPGPAGQVKFHPGSGIPPLTMQLESWSNSEIMAIVPQVQPLNDVQAKIEVVDSRGNTAFSVMSFVLEGANSTVNKAGPKPGESKAAR